MYENLITYTKWHRRGLRYQFIINYNYPFCNGQITVSWGIITHHIVKWIHGPEELDKSIFRRIELLKAELSRKSTS